MQPKAKKKSWQGKAQILEVVDGDTVKVFADLGFKIFAELSVRVHGVNCPEMPAALAVAAKMFTEELLPVGSIITLDSRRIDLHGRAEAVILLEDGRDLGTELVRCNHAVPANDRGNL